MRRGVDHCKASAPDTSSPEESSKDTIIAKRTYSNSRTVNNNSPYSLSALFTCISQNFTNNQKEEYNENKKNLTIPDFSFVFPPLRLYLYLVVLLHSVGVPRTSFSNKLIKTINTYMYTKMYNLLKTYRISFRNKNCYKDFRNW